MFTDEHRRSVWDQIRQHDLRQFSELLTPQLLKEAVAQSGAAMGRGVLSLATLCWLALSCALNDGCSFTWVLTLTLRQLADMNVGPASPPRSMRRGPHGKVIRRGRRCRHDPRGRARQKTVSEEAFVQARQKMPSAFWAALIQLLGQAFLARHEALVRYCGLRLLALDGTCVNLPTSKANKAHYGTAANGLGRRQVQGRLVMLQWALTRLPWRYELTPLSEGERSVAARLLKSLSLRDLVLMDKGFWSYGLFQQIARSGCFFGIRLMKGVKLQTLDWLGENDRIVRWTPSDRQWKKAGLPPSMMLRVMDYQIKGFRPSAIVTNLLNVQLISREKWTGLASGDAGRRLEIGLYHRRWEIETSFQELKVRQGMEKSLRGLTPQTVAYEVAGHVTLYLLVRWLIVEAARKHNLDPLELSFTNALRELELMAAPLLAANPRRVSQVLLPRLLDRIATHRVLWRPGRSFPRPKDGKVKHKGRGKKQLPAKIEVGQA